jgi:hypothetical protein
VLLRYGMAAALQTRPGPIPARLNNSLSEGSFLPAELEAVLKLPQPLRACFALRMLGGFSVADCGPEHSLHPLVNSAPQRRRSQWKEDLRIGVGTKARQGRGVDLTGIGSQVFYNPFPKAPQAD